MADVLITSGDVQGRSELTSGHVEGEERKMKGGQGRGRRGDREGKKVEQKEERRQGAGRRWLEAMACQDIEGKKMGGQQDRRERREKIRSVEKIFESYGTSGYRGEEKEREGRRNRKKREDKEQEDG